MEQCVDRFGLRPHIRLDTAVRAATWDDADGLLAGDDRRR